jgi:hypothetical protein
MGRGATAAAALVLVIAACGTASDDEPTASSAPPDASSTREEAAGSGWCPVFDSLEASSDVAAVDVDGAPEEILEPLQVLVDDAELAEPDDDPAPGTLRRLLEAAGELQAWGHEHCDADHPFCSVWLTITGTLAALGLSGDAEASDEMKLRALVEAAGPVAVAHVPDELRDELDTALASTRWSSAPSEPDERAAEAAFDALDEWMLAQGCAGASEPTGE